MDIYVISLAVVSGICLAFGILFLFTGLRRKDGSGPTVLFSLFALSYAAVILTGIANYSATSVDDWLSSARLDGVFVVLTWSLLIAYVAVYTGVKPRIFLALLLAAFVTSGIANVVRPNLIHAEILGLASVTLPWGEQLTFVEATDSIWATVFLVANLVTIGYVVAACTLQFLRGERQPALVLGAGMSWFIFTIIVDILVDLGIAPLYLGDFGFLGLAIVLGLQLTDQVIRTEEELAEHRYHLEELVEERTAALEKMNVQLESEIRERTLADDTLQQRVDELAFLNRITQTLVNVTDLPLALQQVCEAVAHQLDAQYAHIILPSTEAPELQVLVGFESESGAVGAAQLPVSFSETPYFAEVFSQAKTLTVSDVQALSVAAPLREFIASRRIQNTMLVPLVIRRTAIGLLAIATDQADRAFTSDQVLLAETIAGDVAGAIENARLLEQSQAAAVSEERSRLARELHDSVTQVLFSINLIAMGLGRLWKRNPEMGARSTDELQRLTRGALAEMRTLLRELRPQTIANTELSTLLKQLSDGLSARHDIPVDVEAGQVPNIPQEVHVALYRIAQEALSNVAKHAEASRVAVELVCHASAVQLTITDDGQGFDPESVPAEHMGLDIMRERADAIGADLKVASRPSGGTSVAILWPIPQSGGDTDAKS